MPSKTPSFWYPSKDTQSLPLKAKLLKPLSSVYAFAFKTHQASKSAKKADIPVLCIGNLSAGGTGKTPTCIAIVDAIKASGIADNPYFLMRGYGGAERGPLLVDLNKHTAWDVGDEALILAKHAPTVVSADRVEGANLARLHGADIVVMDDGLQNPGIHKDIKIIVVNGEMGFGNKLVMPAGPLREPLEAGLEKADAFLIIGDDVSNTAAILPEKTPVFSADLKAVEEKLPPKEYQYFAFAGLGYPNKFFNFLEHDLGFNVTKTVAFPDHCPYTAQDMIDLQMKADALQATLITTEKDFLRIPKDYQDGVATLPVSMVINEHDSLMTFIKGSL